MLKTDRTIRWTAALLLFAALGGCGSPEEKANEYLASARDFISAGEMDKADIELRNALKLNPRLAEAHYLRAKVFESRRAGAEMFREAQTAVQIDENHLEANLMLAAIYTGGGKVEEAQAAIDHARKAAPADFRVTRAQAALHARESRLDEALVEARAALAASPGDVDTQVLLGGILLQMKNYDECAQHLDAALAEHPDADALYLLQFQLRSTQGKVEEAAGTLRTLIERKPGQAGYRQALALYYARNERPADAEAVLRQAIADLPEDTNAKLALASFLATTDTKAAADALRGFIEAGGAGTEQLQLALAELYTREGDLDEAAEMYRAVSGSEDKTEALMARNQLARIAFKQGNATEAASIVDAILRDDPGNAEALLTRAGLRLTARETDTAIADLREALGQDPNLVRAHVLLAQAHLQNGSTEQAKASLVDALKLQPTQEEAAVQLAEILLQERQFARVLEVLQPVTSGQNVSRRAQALQLQAKLAMQDWAAAEELAGKLGEQADNPEYQRYVGALALQAQGKHAEAIGEFGKVLAAQPGMTGALAGIARSHREQGKAAEAVAAVQAFVRDHPQDLAARQLLATEQLRDGDLAGARASLEAGLAIDPKWPVGYRGLGLIANREEKPAEALAIYDRALSVLPNSVEFKLQAAGVMERTGDKKGAEQRYRDILAATPGADIAANNLAVLLAGDGSDKARLEEAATIAKRFESSEQPYFADTYAWILHQQGNDAKAAQLLERVVSRAPEVPIFQYHRGAVLFALNDLQTAKVHLSKAEKLAEIQGKFDGYDEARALLAKIP
jgi:tetratricopeptide (TPR) repeat protein